MERITSIRAWRSLATWSSTAESDPPSDLCTDELASFGLEANSLLLILGSMFVVERLAVISELPTAGVLDITETASS